MSSTTENADRGQQNVQNQTKPENADSGRSHKKKNASKKLTAAQQGEFLDWLLQGASPQVACRKLQVPLAAFWRTLENNPRFAKELQQVWDTLSFNVVAALYQAAIKGNGTAQQFWLKHRPAPRWAQPSEASSPTDDWETLSDAELLDRARTEAPDLAAEIAARIAATRSGFASEAVSKSGDAGCE